MPLASIFAMIEISNRASEEMNPHYQYTLGSITRLSISTRQGKRWKEVHQILTLHCSYALRQDVGEPPRLISKFVSLGNDLTTLALIWSGNFMCGCSARSTSTRGSAKPLIQKYTCIKGRSAWTPQQPYGGS